MFGSSLFPSFQPLLGKDAEGQELSKKIEVLILERNRWGSGYPSLALLREFSRPLPSFRHTYDTLPQSGPGAPPFKFYRKYAKLICSLKPLVDAAKWPRWLLLERTLSSASVNGDLLTTALALRTQIEALDDLLLLQDYERQLPKVSALDSHFSVTAMDCHRIRNHATLLWSRFLPALKAPDVEKLTKAAEMPETIWQRAPDLANAFTALNDYVHPNYGSHIQAIWPEQAKAQVVLLRSFAAIYSTFFDLAWTRQYPDRREPEDAITETTNWNHTVIFVEKTLPQLSRTLINDHQYPEEWRAESSSLSVFSDELLHQRERWDRLGAAWSKDKETHALEPQLRAICSTFTPAGDSLSAEEIFFFPKQRTGFGLPATAAEWLHLSSLRRHAALLEKIVSELSEQNAFPTKPPYDKWVEFLKTALELSVMAGIHKMNLMKVAAKRNMNEKNFFGAILCARSMMESYAVALWLSTKFNGAWEKIEDAALHNRDLGPLLSDLESDVGRYLAGTKRTEEINATWRSRWIASGRAKHVNLRTAVDRAFEKEADISFLYDWFCRVIHGDRLTGGDLLEPGSKRIAEKQTAKVLMVLAFFESRQVELEIIKPVLKSTLRMSRPKGLKIAGSPEEINAIIQKGTIRNLSFVAGRDMFGSGSEADPYYFRPDLQYHQAFYAYLEDKEIRDYTRSVWTLPQRGFGDRIEAKNGHVIFFWNREDLTQSRVTT